MKILLTNQDGAIRFRRVGDRIEIPGFNYSGKITVRDEEGAYQIWGKTAGSCRVGIASRLSAPAWLVLVRIEGDRAFEVQGDEPGRKHRAYLRELRQAMAALTGTEPHRDAPRTPVAPPQGPPAPPREIVGAPGLARLVPLYQYRYPRPAVTVDILVFRELDPEIGPEVLLIRRKKTPFAGSWSLPGGFVNEGEKLAAAAQRELREETGLDLPVRDFHQQRAYGDPGRDPRGWTVAVVFRLLFGGSASDAAVLAGDDAAEAAWFPLGALPPLAFDHERIVREGWEESNLY